MSLAKRRRAAFHLSCLALGLMVMGYGARTASAQVLYGSVVGTLTDETGAVVSKAVVTVKNTSTGLSRQATTDETGHYAIQNLVEGTYDVSVSAAGFKPYTQTGVNVPINSVTRIDVTVQVGALTDQVTVEGSGTVLQTTKSDVNTHLDTEAIENLPHAPRVVAITLRMTLDKDRVRAELIRRPERQRGMDAELAGFVGRRRHHAALIALAADYHGLALERGIEQLFHGYEERIHIQVEDRS